MREVGSRLEGETFGGTSLVVCCRRRPGDVVDLGGGTEDLTRFTPGVVITRGRALK